MQKGLAANKKNKKKKGAVAVFAVLLAVIIAAVSVFVYFNNANKKVSKTPFVYYTENELFACKNITKNTKSHLISDKYAGYYKFSSDGEYILYSANKIDAGKDKNGEDVYRFDLLYKKIFEKSDTGKTVAKGVTSIKCVSGDLGCICYEKDGDIYVADNMGGNNLIQKSSRVIACNVRNKLILTTSNTESENKTTQLSLVDLDSKKAQEITNSAVEYAYNPTLENVYFTDKNNLYLAKFGSNNKKIERDKNVSDLVFADGRLYYIMPDKSFNSVLFVEDKCEQSDIDMKEPDWNDYLPDENDYVKSYYDSLWDMHYTETDYEAFDADYRKAEQKYNKAMDEYHKAKARVKLRKELKNSKNFISTNALYSYNGIRQQVAENIYSITAIPSLTGGGALRVEADTFTTPFEKLKKIDIKKISSPADVESYVKGLIEYTANTVNNTKISKLYDKSERSNVEIAGFYSDLDSYLIKTRDSADDESFYCYLVKEGNELNKKSFVAEDCSRLTFIDNKTAYYNEYSAETQCSTLNYQGEQFKNTYGSVLQHTEKQIDPETKKELLIFYFIADYNKDTKCGNVYEYENGKSKIIRKNVYCENGDYGILDDKQIYIDNKNNLLWISEDEPHQIAQNVKGFDNTQLKKLKTY